MQVSPLEAPQVALTRLEDRVQNWVGRRDARAHKYASMRPNASPPTFDDADLADLTKEWKTLWQDVNRLLSTLEKIVVTDLEPARCEIAKAGCRSLRRRLIATCVIVAEHPPPVVLRGKTGDVRLILLCSEVVETATAHDVVFGGTVTQLKSDDGDAFTQEIPLHLQRERKKSRRGSSLSPAAEFAVVTVSYGGETPQITLAQGLPGSDSRYSSPKYLYKLRFDLAWPSELVGPRGSGADAGVARFSVATRPFALISNTSQKSDGHCASFWHRYFGQRQQAPSWKELFDKLSEFFEEMTGRGLKGRGGALPVDYQEACLKGILFRHGTDDPITYDWLTDGNFMSLSPGDKEYHRQGIGNKFSRWKYVYSYVDLLLLEHGRGGQKIQPLLDLWKRGVILGFVGKEEWFARHPSANVLLRFRTGKPARLCLSYHVPDVGAIPDDQMSKLSLTERMAAGSTLQERILELAQPRGSQFCGDLQIVHSTEALNEIKVSLFSQLFFVESKRDVQQDCSIGYNGVDTTNGGGAQIDRKRREQQPNMALPGFLREGVWSSSPNGAQPSTPSTSTTIDENSIIGDLSPRPNDFEWNSQAVPDDILGSIVFGDTWLGNDLQG